MSITIRPEAPRTYNEALRSWLPYGVECAASYGDKAARRVLVAYRAHRRNHTVDTWRAFLAAKDAYAADKARMEGAAAAEGRGGGCDMSEWRDCILTGDAVDLMSQMPDESVNIVLTSPPYNIGLKYDGFSDELSQEDFEAFTRSWLTEAYRVTADHGRMMAIVHDEMLWWMRPMLEDIGWNWGQLLVWCKPNFVGGTGRNSGDWNRMTEHIIQVRKGKRTPMLAADCTTHNWFLESTPQSNFNEGRIHPAQLPLALCSHLLARTPGDMVLDPFAGSGSVLIAARGLGRQWLGFELVEEVAQRARDRMAGIRDPRQMALFAEAATP